MGAYDFIEDQIETYGDEYVNSMIDSGYEPCYLPEKGWYWLLVKAVRPLKRSRSFSGTS